MSYGFALRPRDPWAILAPGRLQSHVPSLERVTTSRYIETHPDDTGIQVSLSAGELAVAIAYWHTESAAGTPL